MALPRFFSRVVDAIGPVANLDPAALARHLDEVTIHLHNDHGSGRERDSATLLAANLAARLYPTIRLHGTQAWTRAARRLILSINPVADVKTVRASDQTDAGGPKDEAIEAHLSWALQPSAAMVRIGATGWNAMVDASGSENAVDVAHPLAAAAAACLGMAEIFRFVFAAALGDRGRLGVQPGTLNLIALEEAVNDLPLTSEGLALPRATLIGAGAIGEACLWALGQAGVELDLTIVDPEPVTLSNLQRYVLTADDSVDQTKVGLAEQYLATSRVRVSPVPTAWGADRRSGPGTDVVLVALDSAADRIAVAASLPRQAFNAWTQPQDIGWSRHEKFGHEPCLACLYYPDRPRPSEHELIGAALGESPLRILMYLITQVPIGAPLPGIASLPDLPAPPDAHEWLGRPLLVDLINRGIIPVAEVGAWAGMPIGQVYRDGICAGGLLRLPDGPQTEAALVPLAHQSALAGIMLAAQLIAAHDPALVARRSPHIEGRLDLLKGLPQVLGRPRRQTPNCICADPIWRHATDQPSEHSI